MESRVKVLGHPLHQMLIVLSLGELVDRMGVGVDPGANLDAPSSLSRRPPEPAHRGAR
ncbi:MAG TPA: hypothetical protein VF092_11980 [Longimicrobium sp.]